MFAKIPEDSRFYIPPKETIRKNNFLPVGFVVASKNIYLTTNMGKLFVVDIETGKTKSIINVRERCYINGTILFIFQISTTIK